MGKTSKKIIYKLASISSLVFGIAVLVAVIGIIVMISYSNSGMNYAKMYLIDLVLLIMGIAAFVLCLGAREFFKSVINLEDEVKELEEEVATLESKEGQTNG
jgi:hypothetical protein